MHSAIVLSLLASRVFAQYGYGPVSSSVASSSPLPTFEIVTSGAAITPPTTSAPVAVSTSIPFDDDRPKPYESVLLPALESFIASIAPAFTEKSDSPFTSPFPVYSSTPCSSTVIPTDAPAIASSSLPFDDDLPKPSESVQVPASESFIASEAPVFTATSLGDLLPTYSGTPCSTTIVPTQAPESSSSALPTDTPKPATSTPCTESEAQPTATPEPATSTPCTESEARSTGTPLGPTSPTPTNLPPYPTGSDAASYYPSGTGNPSGAPHPTGSDRPTWHHGHYPNGGFGWGRPRPSGMWPANHYHYPRPTGSFHHRPRPSAAFDPNGRARTTPCTLETRARPTATALVR
jgi:hypothetical protein